MSPVEIVQQQVAAYNARDLAGFIAMYSDTVTVFRMPSAVPTISGIAEFSNFYATQRFNVEALHAEIVNRMVFGNKVIDHERIHGLKPDPMEIVAVYDVGPALIKRVWFFPAE